MEIDTITSKINALSLDGSDQSRDCPNQYGNSTGKDGNSTDQYMDCPNQYENSTYQYEDSMDTYMTELEYFYKTVCKKHTTKCHPTTVKGFDGISFKELKALYSIYKNRYVNVTTADFRSRVFFTEGYVWSNGVQQYYWYIHHINMQEIAANIPEEIGDLTRLSTLNYSWNELVEVPSTVWNLSLLQSLDLSHNCLDSIPEAISGLTNLRSLYLNHNSIETVPSSLYELSRVQYVDLSYNPIRSMPPGIEKMKSLTVLRLHHTYMRQYPKGADKIIRLMVEDLHADYNSKCISWRHI